MLVSLSKQFKQDTRICQIVYNLDIAEIIIKTGKKDCDGRMYIYFGFDGNDADKFFESKIDQKLKAGWKKMKKHPMSENEILDKRLEEYDYDGKKKINKKE
jgi:hypothetical protein